MRQAIVTKYIGPTNHRGSRIKVSADAGTMYVGWDYTLDITANHTAAAKQFAEKYSWHGQWCGGSLPQRTGGNCYVNPPGRLIGGVVNDDSNFYVKPPKT